MKKVMYSLILFAITAITAALPAVLGITAVDSCQNLSVSEYYVLNQSVNSSGDCMIMSAADSVLDCQGFNITGPGGSTSHRGVDVTATNVTIKNCFIRNFGSSVGHGIFVQSSGAQITNNTISGSFYAIRLFAGGSHEIWDNVMSSVASGGRPLDVQSSNNNHVYNNTLTGPGSIIPLLWQSAGSNNVYENNTISGSHAIQLQSGSNNIIRNNLLTASSLGITMGSVTNTTVRDNVISGPSYGLYGGSGYVSVNATVYNNTFMNNVRGIYIATSGHSGNVAFHNTFTGSTLYHIDATQAGWNFNTTINGTGQGNHYDDILALEIGDFDGDGWADAGSDYPYNATSSSKINGIAVDYAPYTTKRASLAAGNSSSVVTTGLSNLSVTVNGQTVNNNIFVSTKEVIFSQGARTLVNLSHNFSNSTLNLSAIELVVQGPDILINLNGQETEGTSKTLSIPSGSVLTICADNSNITSLSQISIACTDPEETQFTAEECTAGSTKDGITCAAQGDFYVLSNLSYSGVDGTEPVPEFSTVALIATLVMLGGFLYLRR